VVLPPQAGPHAQGRSVVRRDPAAALQLFKRALERGVGAAANGIGVLAYNGAVGALASAAAAGEGADAAAAEAAEGYASALRWFERGANMSDADSTYNLGTMYLHGVWCVFWARGGGGEAVGMQCWEQSGCMGSCREVLLPS
jgi:TPR repeat protein